MLPFVRKPHRHTCMASLDTESMCPLMLDDDAADIVGFSALLSRALALIDNKLLSASFQLNLVFGDAVSGLVS